MRGSCPPVVQKVDNAIQRVNHCPLDNAISFPNTYRWIVIYPVDSPIQLLNNWGLVWNSQVKGSKWRTSVIERTVLMYSV